MRMKRPIDFVTEIHSPPPSPLPFPPFLSTSSATRPGGDGNEGTRQTEKRDLIRSRQQRKERQTKICTHHAHKRRRRCRRHATTAVQLEVDEIRFKVTLSARYFARNGRSLPSFGNITPFLFFPSYFLPPARPPVRPPVGAAITRKESCRQRPI